MTTFIQLYGEGIFTGPSNGPLFCHFGKLCLCLELMEGKEKGKKEGETG